MATRDLKWEAAQAWARQQHGDPDRKAVRRGALDAPSYNPEHQGWGPWIELNSTRIAAARFDSSNQTVMVSFVGGGKPYLYSGVSSETFTRFVKSGSPGRALGMLGGTFRPATPAEIDAPSS
jgi:KTSC domain